MGVRVTSLTNVRKTYPTVQFIRTKFVTCTDFEHIGRLADVPVRASDVVRSYLAKLLQGRLNKKRLAEAMETSRSHLDEILVDEDANLMSKHVDGIAAAIGSTPRGVWLELAGVAKELEDAVAPAELQGRQDRRSASVDLPEKPDAGEGDEPTGPELPSPRPRRPAGQSPRRSR